LSSAPAASTFPRRRCKRPSLGLAPRQTKCPLVPGSEVFMSTFPVKPSGDLSPPPLARQGMQRNAAPYRRFLREAKVIPGLIAVATLLDGCTALDRLINIGEQPKLSAIDNPTAKAGYKPVQMPMPAPQPASYNPNSLWRNGSRAFFKDQRAHQVGDILTVKVKITDKATLENETQRSRKNSEDSGVTDFLGSKLLKNPSAAILPGKILTADSTASSEGKGTIDRKEELLTNVAGVVIQVLPNGNLVIEGKQEVRVNYEVRELVVAGVVRPEDIESDNTIDSTKIAEARIAYGGRGQITDVQQPRYGQQVLDVLLPF
jgi:flagellar L-ring protein FlgH